MTNANPIGCTERVPQSLWGDLTGPASPRCTLAMPPDGNNHAGQHRASVTVAGVGKVVYRWKNTSYRSPV